MEELILNLIARAKELNGVHVVDIGKFYSEKEREQALKEMAYALQQNTKQRGINLGCSIMHFYKLGATAVFGDKGLAISFTHKDDTFDIVTGEYVSMSQYSEGQVIPFPVKNTKTRPTVVSSIVHALRTKYILFKSVMPDIIETQDDLTEEVTQ
jgi:hypothetical protein